MLSFEFCVVCMDAPHEVAVAAIYFCWLSSAFGETAFLEAAFFFLEGTAFFLAVFFVATFFFADFLGAALFFLEGVVFFLADVFCVAFFLTMISLSITSLPVRICLGRIQHRAGPHC